MSREFLQIVSYSLRRCLLAQIVNRRAMPHPRLRLTFRTFPRPTAALLTSQWPYKHSKLCSAQSFFDCHPPRSFFTLSSPTVSSQSPDLATQHEHTTNTARGGTARQISYILSPLQQTSMNQDVSINTKQQIGRSLW
jgi:hypothetical protein